MRAISSPQQKKEETMRFSNLIVLVIGGGFDVRVNMRTLESLLYYLWSFSKMAIPD